jgi:hypothetical protein
MAVQTQQQAARALASLARDNSSNQQAITKAGASSMQLTPLPRW